MVQPDDGYDNEDTTIQLFTDVENSAKAIASPDVHPQECAFKELERGIPFATQGHELSVDLQSLMEACQGKLPMDVAAINWDIDPSCYIHEADKFVLVSA